MHFKQISSLFCFCGNKRDYLRKTHRVAFAIKKGRDTKRIKMTPIMNELLESYLKSNGILKAMIYTFYNERILE